PPRGQPPSGGEGGGTAGPLAGAPADAARSEIAAGHYREAAESFRKAAGAGRGYALQLEIACQDSSIREGAGHAGSGGEYFVLPFTLKGRQCYRVLWGVYPDAAAARRAEASVPAFFRSQSGGRPLPGVM